MLRISNYFLQFAEGVGKVAAWLVVPLILVTVFDVVTRRFFVLGSTRLQELEWHFHAALLLLCLGYGYSKNVHVRVDLLHAKASSNVKAWIEAIGCALFLVPYTLLIIYTGFDFAMTSFLQGETSPSASGLTHRWIIKSMVFVGFILVLSAAVGVFLRAVHVILRSDNTPLWKK